MIGEHATTPYEVRSKTILSWVPYISYKSPIFGNILVPPDLVTVKSLKIAWQKSVAYLCDAGAPMGTSYGGYHEAYVAKNQ